MVVCHCLAMNDVAISDIIDAGERSVDAIVAACGAGGRCGGCRPVIEELVEGASVRVSAAAHR